MSVENPRRGWPPRVQGGETLTPPKGRRSPYGPETSESNRRRAGRNVAGRRRVLGARVRSGDFGGGVDSLERVVALYVEPGLSTVRHNRIVRPPIGEAPVVIVP
jgi:hypothetical protein